MLNTGAIRNNSGFHTKMNLGKRMDARLLQQIPPQTEIRKTGHTAGKADIYYYR